MKVGILSKQRVVNYGSFLQAYALRKIIEDMSHKVEFLDLKPQEGKNVNYIFDEPRWKRILRGKIRGWDLTKDNEFYEARQDLFINKLFPKLGLPYYPNFDTHYDAVLIGSDEMFNCTEDGTFWGESMQMFGDGIESERIFSYAASFGYTTLERLKQKHLDIRVGELLKKNFQTISVRDPNSANIVEAVSGIKPEMHLDPVLIYDFSRYMPKRVKHRDYIAVYGYDHRMHEKEYIDQLVSFAHSHGKKLIGVGLWQDWCDENVLLTPFEVMAYMRDADYVFCETFHGAIFSIKFNKNFVCLTREANYNKLHGLLEIFGLTDRLVNEGKTVDEIFNVKPDFTQANERIKKEQARTMAYLERNLT